MKLKTDQFMWLKNIKENKNSYLYWGYLTVIGIIFYIMNCYTPLYSDDWHYCFIYGTTEPIESISDIIKSQYTHYFEMNGRFIPHFIVQFFDGIAGKECFNVTNTIVFILFLHLLSITIGNNKNFSTVTLATFFIFFFLPGFKLCFLWMSGSCNYLWSATLLLTFNFLLRKNTNNIYIYPLYFIYGIICGWTHEGLVIGLCSGYIFYFALRKERLNTSTIILLTGFFTGATFLILSPGSIQRAIGNNNSISIINTIQGYLYSLYKMNSLRLLPILILALTIRKKQLSILQFIQNNIQLSVAILTTFLFVIFTKHTSGHSRFGIELFSLILLLKLIPRATIYHIYIHTN